jgi:uncharacterized protein with GYD domain
MAKYLFEGNYVGEGVKGLIKEGGSSRTMAATALMESVGCKLEAFYYAFGEYDFIAIIEAPDHAAIASLALTLNASGAIQGKTTVLLSAAEVDAATKLSPTYRPPGK